MLNQFEKFTKSKFALEIRQKGKIIFRSRKQGIAGLVEFIKQARQRQNLVIFDKIVGRAAALLFVYLKAKQVFGVVASQPAVRVLKKSRIKYYFKKTVANILNKDKTGPCPMEKLSRSRTPGELYNLLKE